MRAPDYVQPLIGWRVWLVVETGHGLRLASVLHDEAWQVGEETVASCRRLEDPFAEPVAGLHLAPFAGCSCGIYAAREPETALPYLRGRDEPWTVARVLGTVALWGDVVEAEGGWRAARAYPVSLQVADAELAAELAAYGVPISSGWRVSRSSPTCTGMPLPSARSSRT